MHESLLEVSPVAMAILSSAGKVLYANPAFGDVFGVKPAQLRNRELAEFAPVQARSYVVERVSVAGQLGSAHCKWAELPNEPWVELFLERALEDQPNYLLVRAWRGQPPAYTEAPALAPLHVQVSEPEPVADPIPQYAVVEEPVEDGGLIDISALAAEVSEDLRRRTGATAAVKIQPDMQLKADPGLLKLVLQHLIDNAIKFVPAGETARIEVGISEGVLFVRDHGIGFDPAQSNAIFKPFERLPEASAYPGAGIGLASVKRIVERLGGMVWAISKPGRGATFFVRL